MPAGFVVRLGGGMPSNWGFVGSKGREQVEIFSDEAEAAQALETRATAQRQKGYTNL
jgi:predicted DNA-binding WGR domain protein